jgi:hypothetical protein
MPLGRAIYLSVDHLDPWWTRSFTDNPTFTRVSLSDVRVIMMILHVLMEELLCQVMMGWVPVLVWLLLGACGC